MPRTGLSPEEMRAKALDAAETLIRRHGIERTRLVDIARSVGVNHAMLYRHFSDKAELIDAVSERWLKLLRGELGKIAPAGGDAPGGLKLWFLSLHRLLREKYLADPELYRSFSLASDDKRPFVGSHMAAIRWQLAKLVTAAVQTGQISDGDPLRITVLLFEATTAFHHPIIVQDLAAEDREPLLTETLDVLITGLQASPASVQF